MDEIFQLATGLKGEFEGEGASREQIAREFALSCKHGIEYLVKIGGCEAKTDIAYLESIGINSLTAPMIETEFAMQKFMSAIKSRRFSHIGVTIETKTAVKNIHEILEIGDLLTNVTVGRSDLSLSMGGIGAMADQITDSVAHVATAVRARGLEMTVGGSICIKTRELFRNNTRLAELVSFIETRKVVMPMEQFLIDGVLEKALAFELSILETDALYLEGQIITNNNRIEALKARL